MTNKPELNLLLEAIEENLIEIKNSNNILHEKYKKAIGFIKMIDKGFCLSDSDEQGLIKLVAYEQQAEELLHELGEL